MANDLWKKDEIESLYLMFNVKRLSIDAIAERLVRTHDAIRIQLNNLGMSSRVLDETDGQCSSTGGIITHPAPYLTVHLKRYPKQKLGGRG
jgi:hypothetical protein